MSPRWRAQAALAAWLEQPVVIAGHHWNAAHGLGFMAEISAALRGWGDVCWCSLTEIARAHFNTHDGRSFLKIKLASRHMQVQIPPGERKLVFERPWIADIDREPLLVEQSETGQVLVDEPCGRFSEPLSVRCPMSLRVRSRPPREQDPARVPGPRPNVWPIVRRSLTETRDRIYPLIR
jgi:hypothetical protein